MLLAPMIARLQGQPDLASALQTAVRDVVALHGAEFGNEPLFLPFRDLAEHAPFRAVLSSPLCPSTGDCIGVVSVHFTNPRVATDIEIHTLESYCRTASDHLLSKQSAAEIARQAEKLHRSMLESQRSTA